MRPKSLLLLVLALGCGLVASIGISQVLERNAKPTVIQTAPIYVAKHNINLGDPIDANMLSLEEWPKDKIPRGAISNLEDLQGRRPRTAIIEGEPILEAKLLAPGQIADPIRSIPKGYRLFTIAVDAEKSAAGLLGPGDRVDVQLFVRKDARVNIAQPKSKVILQNIRVFAVDQAVQRSPDGGDERRIAKTVSLLVKPDQANKLTLAQNLGQVSLIPRNPDDEESSAVAEVSTDELFGEAEKSSRAKEQGIDETTKPAEPDTSALITAVQAVPPKPPFVMEIVEANAVRTMDFDAETGKPIREPHAKASGPTVNVPSASGAALEEGAPEPTAADPGKMLDDFPIEFGD